MNKIDWDEIEDAVMEYGRYSEDRIYGPPPKDETEQCGFEATMVRIHNAVREGTSK